MHLTGLLHDLGKVLAHPAFGEQPQWAVVGDTFPTGIAPEASVIFQDLFAANPDLQVGRRWRWRRRWRGARRGRAALCLLAASPAAPAAAGGSAGRGARPSVLQLPLPPAPSTGSSLPGRQRRVQPGLRAGLGSHELGPR